MENQMIEIIKHALGLCGDSHISIWGIVGGGVDIPPTLHYIQYKLNYIKQWIMK